MSWQAFSAIATAVTGIVILMSVEVLRRQLVVLRKATYGQAFLGAATRLQDERLRIDRGTVFGLDNKPLRDWTVEEKDAAERVCHNYDLVGIMVRAGVLPKELIVNNWCDSILRLWPICEPLVKSYRDVRTAPEFWDDFELLYEEAVIFRKRSGSRAGAR